MAHRQWTAFSGSFDTPVDINNVQFLMYTQEDIRKLSVVEVTKLQTFDSLGHPVAGGLHDTSMGPLRDKNDLCKTCNNSMFSCPGHLGRIELPLVVVNPLFFKHIYSLFRMSCIQCHRLQISDALRTTTILQLRLLNAGLVTDALDLEGGFGEITDDIDKNKTIRKFKKKLKNLDPVAEIFHSKNLSVHRNRFIGALLKFASVTKRCRYCKKYIVKITKSESKLMYNNLAFGGKGNKIMMADEIKKHCTLLWENENEALGHLFPILQMTTASPATDLLFFDVLPVPPPLVRPCNVLLGEVVEHPQTVMYKKVLEVAFKVRTVLAVINSEDAASTLQKLPEQARYAYLSVYGTETTEKLHSAWQDLQKSVDQLLSSTSPGTLGLKQFIERKTGLIRMHMMGKRVNFAARSVITPDPFVDIDEIGIPDVFALNLTYPVPVTPWNVEELRQMVINGPSKHPGAVKLENANGRVIIIPPDSIEKRKSLAKQLLTPEGYKTTGLKKVHRHLLNGDVMLLNRQPTLHKPSIMAHRARILKGEKTFRLHYANCKAYNADFDGDEMNAHFPQNEIARSEGYNIMSVQKQYLVPKDGTPLSGLIQDHVISGVKISIRGKFFSKSDYQQMVFQGMSKHRGTIKLLPPAILKPQRLWSGKQILSTIILNTIPEGQHYLSLESKAKISTKAWQTKTPRAWLAGGVPFSDPNTMSEAEVIIRKGELLTGVLDKTHYGTTPYGLVHCMFELYGGASSCSLLSAFSKLFTFYLQWEGFSLGIRDILVVKEADEKRNEYIRLIRDMGNIAAAQATELPVDTDENTLRDTIAKMHAKNPKFRATLDRQYKTLLDSYTNDINKTCLADGLVEKFPANNLQLMVQSGAKGSTVNTMQISCLLGQIELEGKRPPVMISGKTLPSFLPYDITPRAGGFIDGRFLTGIQPQEFFFHCMAGREGLIDTAVKTSRSGYLQRCLIKHLEGLLVSYDMTVRDSDNSVIQFAYGEDGLDVCKSQFLKKELISFLDTNSKAIVEDKALDKIIKEKDNKLLLKTQKKVRKWIKKYGDPTGKRRSSPFVEFSKEHSKTLDDASLPNLEGRHPSYGAISHSWQSLDAEEKRKYSKTQCPDPIASATWPEFKFGVISENFDSLIQSYMKERSKSLPGGLPPVDFTEKERFEDIMYTKAMLSAADPGEPVGLLAAQSIGEPSTQMTLNTFHFAGRGDMNVTLGIPRLREILMTASQKLKTPSMDIPFRSDVADINAVSDGLRVLLNRATVADVLEKIDVDCELRIFPERHLQTKLKFTFLPHNQYKKLFKVRPKNIIKHMQKKFFSEMFAVIKKHAKVNSGTVWTADKEGPQKRRRGAEQDEEEGEEAPEPTKGTQEDKDSSDDEPIDDDDDNTKVRDRRKRNEDQDYDDPESGEEENSDDEVEINDEEKEIADNDNDEAGAKAAEGKVDTDVVDGLKHATNYVYDDKHYKWCEITVRFPVSFLKVDLSQAIRDAAERSVMHEVKNIKRAITYKNNEEVILKTEGINITEMFKHDLLLDLNRLYSNDIHAIANTYGIEAASRAIIKEIEGVFNVYGIQVDFRHLSLVSDYMTYNGVFEPMSRKGMDSSSSPLQQMSFESSMLFLKEAIVNAKKDNLRSASSCLMLGQPCHSGTGAFSLYNTVMQS